MLISSYPNKLLLLSRLLLPAPFRGRPSDHLPPSHPIPCLLYSDTNSFHFLFHNIHKSALRSSSFSLAWQLHLPHPDSGYPEAPGYPLWIFNLAFIWFTANKWNQPFNVKSRLCLIIFIFITYGNLHICIIKICWSTLQKKQVDEPKVGCTYIVYTITIYSCVLASFLVILSRSNIFF